MLKTGQKLDPRVIRTRQAFRAALVSLIAEKGFDALTVQDIADRAALNRATFYLHYRDKHDLLVQSLRDAIDELMSDLGPPDQHDLPQFDRPPRPIVRVFEHVAQHAAFYRVMMGAAGVPAFIAGVRDYIAEITLLWLSVLQPRPGDSTVPLEIVASSLSWSLLGVLIWWLEHDMPQSPEYMAEQFRRLMTLGLRPVLGLAESPA